MHESHLSRPQMTTHGPNLTYWVLIILVFYVIIFFSFILDKQIKLNIL